MDLDEVALELYATPPDEFVATRSERVRQAREAGDRALATAIGKLRRPTQSAWLVNLLARQRRELVDELVGIGARFRGESLTRERLNELSARRRELLHQLEVAAQQLSDQAGVQLTADRAREVEATLAAAVADPDAAEQVLGGRLVTALSYSGLGPELRLAMPAPVAAATRGGPGADSGAGGAGEPAAGVRTADDAPMAKEAAARDDAAEQAAGGAAADAAADEAARREAEHQVARHTAAWETAARKRDELLERRDELRTQLRRVQNSLDRAERELVAAERDLQRTADDLDEVRRAVGRHEL